MRLWLRVVRAATAIAIVVALVVQLVRSSDLPAFDAVNFFSYFTVLSNLSAVAVLAALAVRPSLWADRSFSNLRGAATLYMAVTGLVYAVLLAPAAADVSVTLKWVDTVVHVIAPLVVVIDWVVDPPRESPTVAAAAGWLVFPAAWLVYTLVRGPIADWYPYPFLDPALESVASIVVTCVGILVVFVALAAALRWWAGRGERAVAAA